MRQRVGRCVGLFEIKVLDDLLQRRQTRRTVLPGRLLRIDGGCGRGGVQAQSQGGSDSRCLKPLFEVFADMHVTPLPCGF